ncbi:Forkhead-associated (FHA) domain-containing protein [Trifolium repens]|jgi:hypothetical protein|nr:Forkhead-associated (FHA) domain-containing protein [Trifolium repens]
MTFNCFVQNGGSLESLARGVVSFTRRYSFIELRERWHFMLYDLDVSKEAAASTSKLVIAKYKSNKINKAASIAVVIPKRKTQNIRMHYYTMCNRIHK